MSSIAIVLIGFGAGILTMTIVSLYRWIFEIWNGGVG